MPRDIPNTIARLMEDMPMPGNTSAMTGGNVAQMAMTMPDASDADETVVAYGEDEPEGFTEQELRIAKKFIALIGTADRAREIIDKVDECEECLGILDAEQSENRDMDMIDQVAGSIPGVPDLPTGTRKMMDLSSLYNPNATPNNY